MDNYIEELVNVAKLPFNEISKDVKVIFVSNKILYICNYIKILDYSQEKIVIKIPKNTLEIHGEKIYICQINKGEIVIKGKIFSVSYGDKSHEESKE